VGNVILTAESDHARAVLKLAAGAIDIYAQPITDPALFADVAAHPEIAYSLSYSSYRDIRFNTYARSSDPFVPEFDNGRLNPFAVPAIREAMNWLIDRDYLVKQYLGGLGTPRYTALGTAFPMPLSVTRISLRPSRPTMLTIPPGPPRYHRGRDGRRSAPCTTKADGTTRVRLWRSSP
jgi:hypothetical protein